MTKFPRSIRKSGYWLRWDIWRSPLVDEMTYFTPHVSRVSLLLPKVFLKSYAYFLFQDLIRYGKTKENLRRVTWQSVLDVPKRWFWHFYAVSIVWNGVLLVLSVNRLLVDQPYPVWLTEIVGLLTGVPVSSSQVPQVSALLVQVLLWVHSLRRLLESLFISVFSDGAIHIVQYIFGLGYYIILGLTVICADHLLNGNGIHGLPLLSQLGLCHVAGVTIFTWAIILQHRSLVQLARLRTGDSGTVETLAHRMPSGGWFDLVSCPHYFAECLIYVSMSLVSGGCSITWWLVVLYVLFCQALAAQLCHEFYRSKFKSYPKYRKAFIPFVL
ncbi:polyprenal reductase [Aplochiton taeniatus]